MLPDSLVGVMFFFFNSRIIVLGLTCKTRAVSRTPLAIYHIAWLLFHSREIDQGRRNPK